jgi:hypothetical protein
MLVAVNKSMSWDRVRKLYVVRDDAEDIDMLMVHCLLHPFDYKLVRAVCGGSKSRDVRALYHEECIDELVYEVTRSEHTRTLYNVMYDLYGVDSKGKAYMRGMIFVAETDGGEYIEFDMNDVHDVIWQDLVEVEEELEGEEEEEV